MLDQSMPDRPAPENRAATRPIPQAAASRRRLLLVLLIPVVLLLLAVGVVAGYNLLNQGKVFAGVRVGDVALGGMSYDQAQVALTARYGNANASRAGIILEYAGRQWPLSPAEVGVGLDVAQSVTQAMAVGRSNNLFSDLASQWNALRNGAQLSPAWQFDTSTMPKLLAQLHGDIDQPAINAAMSIGADGSINVSPSRSNLHVDDQATEQAIAAALQQSSATPPHVSVVVTEQAPAVTEAEWASVRGTARVMVQPITLNYANSNFSQTLNTADLAPMLDLNPGQGGSPASISLDAAQLDALTARLAPQINTDPADAAFQLDTTNAVASIKPEVVGYTLDRSAAAAAISRAAADSNNRSVDLPVTVLQPTIHASDLSAATDRANALMAGFNLNYTGGPWVIKGERMAVMLQLKRDDSSGKPNFSIAFDQTELNRKLQVISTVANHSSRDALYRLGPDNRPYVATPAIDGQTMDVAATTTAVNAALDAGSTQADASFAVTPAPTYDLSQPLTFPDKLADAWTSLYGSAAARANNVTVGTNSFNNTLIPPGGIYSASDAFGPIDVAHGYQIGYAITHDASGNISTEPAVGGGICQVVTTFFQTAWWSGLKVIDRTNHTYWINLYGTPPLGRIGLDATVFQYTTDLRMQNTTGHWLLVHSWVSHPDLHVHFQMLGTNPNWKIVVSNPIVTNVVKTNATPVYSKSSELPVGTTVLTSHHQDGFDATISRQVYDASGNKLDDITLNSHYVPVYDEYLVGTGGAAKPSATPKP
jgi:vancomycin resistance protein YoaR